MSRINIRAAVMKASARFQRGLQDVRVRGLHGLEDSRMTLAATETATALPAVEQHHRDHRRYPHGVAFMDGQSPPMSEAKVSVLDWGFQHSGATYDTVHVWDGRFFRLDLHLDRFFRSMERLRMKLPYSRVEIEAILANYVALSGYRSANVEMICTRGTSPTFSRDPRQAEYRFIAFAVHSARSPTSYSSRAACTSPSGTTVRIPPKSIDPSIKNYHWLDLVKGLFMPMTMVRRRHWSSIPMTTSPKVPVSTSSPSRKAVSGTPVYSVLPGITRQTVFDLCGELGLSATAGDVGRRELKAAVIHHAHRRRQNAGDEDRRRGCRRRKGRRRHPPADGVSTGREHGDPAWSSPVSYP